MKFQGIGEHAATFLGLLRACAGLYLRQGLMRKKKISSTLELLDYCRAEMKGLRDEQFRTIFLNAQNEVIADEVIQEGTVDQSVVYPRKVMERALYHKASALIFVHNHPSGHPRPSKDDVLLTDTLRKAAQSLQIKVHDHLIISKDGYFSFLEAGLLQP